MAVVGTGHMGRHHVNILSSLPEVELVAISDRHEQTLLNMANKYEVKGYDDYHKLIRLVDAAVIAVPTIHHFEVAKVFLEAGKHVLIEKPIAQTVDEARELIGIARAKNLVLQVGHVERFNAAVQQLKKIVKSPYLIESTRCGPIDKRIKDVGVVMDLMIHDVDIILNIVNEKARVVQAIGHRIYSDHEDVASAQILFEGGCVANILASRVTQFKERSLKISQKDAFVSLNYGEQDLEIHRQASSAYLLTPEEIKYSQESFVEKLHIQKDNPLKLELLHFAACIAGKERPLVDNETDLAALTITRSILESVHTHWNVKS
jgi:predicted dehydrogenase